MKLSLHKIINNTEIILIDSRFSIFLTPKYRGYFFLFKDTNDIPIMTANAPNNCNAVNFSFKKIAAKIMVEIGPTAAMTAKFEELIIFMDADTKNDGMTVANTAIKNPSKYTCHG